MSGLTIQLISLSNIDDVAYLLHQRNRTLESYVRWKYGRQINNASNCGVIGYHQGRPVGCFGLISRRLLLPDNREIEAGWFADWYVAQEMRGQGVGQALLNEITKLHQTTIGQPNPQPAREMCLGYGYKQLGFQSRRRLILNGSLYEKTRTNYFVKAQTKFVSNKLKSIFTKAGASRTTIKPGVPGARCAFSLPHQFGEWILRQPVSPQVKRENGLWAEGGTRVIFIDDHLSTKEIRRRVLFSDGENYYSIVNWMNLARASRKAGCTYLELFTTDACLDNLWARLGAIKYHDAPVLCYGDIQGTLILHGWDRENWTFLAS